MWRFIVVFLSVILVPASGLAQQSSDSWGYYFAAPGFYSPEKTKTMHLGIGMGGIPRPDKSSHLGISMELGYFAPMKSFSSARGFYSSDAIYHITGIKKGQWFAPMLEFGYTRAVGPGSGNLLNYGATVNVWIRPKSGVQAGIRDHYSPNGGIQHVTELRIAWVSRR